MILNRKSATFIPTTLAAGGFLVSAVLFGALSLPPGVPSQLAGNSVAQEIEPAGQDPLVSGFTMPAAKNFIGIVTRPIFASNRRPSSEQEIAIETMTSELEIRLTGVIVVSGSPIAIVAPRDSSAFVRLTVGDRYQGWSVAQIEPDSVTFRRDNAVERIELSYDLPPKRPQKKKPRNSQNSVPKKATATSEEPNSQQD